MREVNSDPKGRRFRRMALITLGAVFFLFLVGSIVRTTGSGMGCPDWPKCFGEYIPPTDISQLPSDYKTKFAVQGKEIADFSAFKTWTEFINRLVGATIGILIFITLIFSTSYLKKDKVVFFFTLLAFFLIGFNAWLGSVVVANNLKPVIISGHMIGAIGVVLSLIYALYRSYKPNWKAEELKGYKKLNSFLLVAGVLSAIQISLGIEVRELVDVVAENMGTENRNMWIEELGVPFYIHRSFSILLLIVNVLLIRGLFKNTNDQRILVVAKAIGVLLFLEIATGVALTYLGMPKFAQPLHLLMAVMILSAQFYMKLLFNFSQQKVSQVSNRVAETV
ncbi:COX15/CtaA family protein [Sediminitomix flava]|uniref:Cytochrome c oxidase assembly protein subunit 15 n=1 Tax=Sediminitomix flava TaxID=379075 RepID=A0A315ZB65_SEDFL|nr:COX15/CtaA family protein [Sediminitomix flava]PWJ42532.1 cytochrome c oxidase assembly protein subunit 15 [Sediminitomix flava]